MKGSCGASLRSLMASSSRPRGKSSFAHSARSLTSVAASVRSFASVSRRDNASDAEGSRASSVDPADIFQPPRERMTHRQTEEEAFKKNLKEVQAWRRGRAATYQKTPFIPKMKDESLPKPQVEPSNSDLALSTLLASGAALGCSSAKINPHFAHYVYGNRAGLSIIDLDQTLPLLRRAANVVRDVVKNDGVVLFVGHRPLLKKSLEKAKGRLGDNGYTTTRWTPGVLTNAESFFGLPAMQDGSYLPDLVVFLHPGDCSHGVRECTNRNVPTIGVVDSDTDPRMVTYPIPANIQSIRTSELVLGALSVAGAEGRRLRIQEEELRAARQKALKQRAERAAGSEQAAYRSRPGR